MSGDERRLEADDVAQLPCTEMIRSTALNWPGIIPESEVVSQSEDFGYVYRYDLAELVREDGEEHTYRAVFVCWSKDCEGYYIAHYPTYRLPDYLFK
jgi:hypothetical protein